MENNEINNQNTNADLNINKQIFLERPVGKITVGKLIVICSFINIGILFILFFFTSLLCLHVFTNNSGFYKLVDPDPDHIRMNGSGVTIIVFDCVFITTSLILQIYIWKYKINLKKSFWKKVFWTLILVTFLFMIFGISDTNTAPWIYVLSSNVYVKSGGWWLILGIFVIVLVYLLVVLLSNILPNKVKHKMSKLVPKQKNEQDEQTTNND